MRISKTTISVTLSLLTCILTPLFTDTCDAGTQQTGQRFRIVVPPKIATLQTATHFRVQTSVPVAMMTLVKKKSGSIKSDTLILHPQDAQYDLSITTVPGDVQSMLLTVCPL